ncbi:MAG TPA: serine protease [Pyrinomonadaceae bacterium]|nr:serine protease [Pyrinomonadaceae bacterium]
MFAPTRQPRHLFTLACLLASLCLLAASTSAQPAVVIDDEETRDGRRLPVLSRTKLLERAATPETFDGEQRLRWVWHYTHESEVAYLRLHVFAECHKPGDTWELIIYDGANRVADRLTALSFAGLPAGTGVWTKIIRGRAARVELQSETKPAGLRVRIDRLNFFHGEPQPKAITTGSDDMKDLARNYRPPHRYYNYGRAVAALFFLNAEDQSEANCTGFLVAPDLLLTNHHCISQPWQLRSAEVRFGWETDGQPESVAISEIVLPDGALDFSLLRLEREVTAWPVAKLGAGAVAVRRGQPLVAIQHPSASLKLISVKDCKVEREQARGEGTELTDFYHLCDTGTGSSGAPVLDESDGTVVGLHHLGDYSRDGRWGRNRAVRIDLVLDSIRRHDENLYKRIVTPSP